MTEISVEADTLYRTSELAKKHAIAQVEQLFADATEETLNQIQNYLEENDPRLWDYYEEPLYHTRTGRNKILRELGLDPKVLGTVQYFSIITHYEAEHLEQWRGQVEWMSATRNQTE